jgi:hypothetical protein
VRSFGPGNALHGRRDGTSDRGSDQTWHSLLRSTMERGCMPQMINRHTARTIGTSPHRHRIAPSLKTARLTWPTCMPSNGSPAGVLSTDESRLKQLTCCE